MNTPSSNRVYQLLPAIYRERILPVNFQKLDTEELKQLLTIIEQELDILETDIGDLYENWFIETCDDWVVPYIGDLLGVSGISTRNSHIDQLTQAGGYGQQETRAYVANTLAYRRRKGTAPVLEQLARDVTGWRGRVVEFFELLAISQNLNHLRRNNTTIDLKASEQIQLVGTPFETQGSYSVEIGKTGGGRGKYNIYNIGLFLWRLQSYPLVQVKAYQGSDLPNLDPNLQGRCYTFSPLGNSIPLFNLPQPEIDITHLAEEINVPVKLRTDPNYPGYHGTNPAFQIFINGQPQPISPEEVLITKLDQDNKKILITKLNQDNNQSKPLITNSPKQIKRVAVDPERGEIVFLDPTLPSQVEVNYAYGFSANIGGGPYDRDQTMAQIPPATLSKPSSPFFSPLYWEVEKERSGSANPLLDAVNTWNGTVKAWQSFLDLTFIPLARLEIPKQLEILKQKVSHLPIPSEARPHFQFGIVNGLTLDSPNNTIGTKEIVITPGLAINKRGIPISIEENIVINLDKIKSKDEIKCKFPVKHPLLVILSYYINKLQPSYQVNVISYQEAENYPEDIYIRLTSFTLDTNGNIETIFDLNSSTFNAGIVEGFGVITPPDILEAIVLPGTAVDDLGRVIILDHNIPLDLRKYQKQTIWLAITYSDIPTGSNWQLYILLDADAKDEKRYPVNRYIRLAHLFVPEITINKLEVGKTISPQFVAGVVKGLKVIGEIGDRIVTITAGKAINGEVKEIILEQDYRFRNLGSYRNKTVTLTIACRQEPFGLNWELKILQADQADDLGYYPQDKYLRLAKLQIGNTGKLTAEPENLIYTFQPGTLTNNLEVANPKSAIVKVTKGKAVDSSGQIISLESDCEIDFSKYPGRELVLFISYQQKQGWKPLDNIDVKTSETGQSWQHLGTVPTVPIEPELNETEPNNKIPKTGIIIIKDNQTYEGDIDLLIPNSEKLHLKLQLLAANGYRPHVRGNISIRGIIEPNYGRSPNFEPGEFLLDGLLIEGNLKVYPGDLKKLVINHCTLRPKTAYAAYGLIVESSTNYQNIDNKSDDTPDPNQADDDDNNEGFIFFVISLFYLISQIIRLSFDRNFSPKQRLQQLSQYVMIEWEKLWCAFQEELYQCQQSDDTNSSLEWLCESLYCTTNQNGFTGDNADLRIKITYSIIGSINLADSVPDLVIYDSIIEKKAMNSSINSQVYPLAITALGAKADIQRSTILGATNVRRLEASTSLFNDVVSVIDRQKGCLRFCYVPLGSQTPLRYRCQPDLALQELPSLPAAITSLAINPIHPIKVFLGTAGQGILQWQETDKTWQPTNLKTEFITALGNYRQSDSKTIFFAGARGGQIFRRSSDQTDWQLINTNINSDPTTFITYTRPLSGTISSQDTVVTGVNTSFTTELNPGDPITIVRSDREETKIVQKINSPTSLILEKSFSPNLSPGTEFKVSILLAGTLNRGVWRFTESGDDWTQMKNDLSPIYSLETENITSLAINSQGRIFAGTDRGIFRWNPKNKHWQPVNQGLSYLQIAALAIDSNDRIFAATATGLIFRSLDHGKHWQSVSNGLSQTRITSLAIQTITGQVQVNDHQLIVTEQIAQKLKEGSIINIDNQSRVIKNKDATKLTVDALFCPALSGNVEFTSHYLFVGTAANGIFRSYNNGDRWESLTPSLIHRQITALLVDQPLNEIWVGTAGGNVFRSINQGEQWEPINQDLVDKITPIVRRIEPRYTTTDYNQPAYAQLSQNCASEIRKGAEDGSEMGVFSLLKQPQREDNLKVLLDEYVRFGLKAGIFYIT